MPNWGALARLMRLDRPIGIFLLLWPTLAGLWLAAGGVPPVKLLVIFTLGVVLTRSAGCVINDYADRWLDGSVARTANRPLATGEISGSQALVLFVALMLAAFFLVLFTNQITIALSLLALLIAVGYPYAKRHTYYPQVILGLAFSMGIPMAYTALERVPDAAAWLLCCANIFWILVYDTLYAMVDRDDDIAAGAKSTAILFGELDLIAIGILQLLAWLSFALVGLRAELSWPYWLALGVIAGLFAYQLLISRKRDPAGCFTAFLHNQWVGAALFGGVVAALMLK